MKASKLDYQIGVIPRGNEDDQQALVDLRVGTFCEEKHLIPTRLFKLGCRIQAEVLRDLYGNYFVVDQTTSGNGKIVLSLRRVYLPDFVSESRLKSLINGTNGVGILLLTLLVACAVQIAVLHSFNEYAPEGLALARIYAQITVITAFSVAIWVYRISRYYPHAGR